MIKSDKWYIRERAEALAVLYLTRRKDITVSARETDDGVDLIVSLLSNGKSTGKIFGVKLTATDSSKHLKKELGRLDENFRGHLLSHIRDVPFPVCLLFFAVDSDVGYYAWMIEPVSPRNGEAPRLRVHQRCAFRELTNDSIDEIIAAVHGWYGARMRVKKEIASPVLT